ncbi:YggS family pyridoxal phosphate-dependent enzyme [Desulforhopalus vacuolatus]|uniref:YggS family pyridoxal phosphate-dependent enzyme n=1 Tax=Desulforhopalus vacuolatus TaxID=40414 RepID=UPI0019627DDF|nr:YggS family pyridoxal phosphate-dependent enzyme [Desulforhopalus vacuolatus]MBM9520528.1 YggS family pyridoxal phosphate-dependent enzyme [Desulforhopalus vacuolatus]
MIKENLARINEQIAAAASRAGRKVEDIQLVAVSKIKPVELMIEALNCGQKVFGENYVQEVQEKRLALPAEGKIHFIGHLQSNKAKIAAEFCDMVETVDNMKLARKLNHHLDLLGRELDILIQVNIGEDPAKSGVEAEETEQLLEEVLTLPRLHVKGLMTIPPFENTPEESRPWFSGLRKLSEELVGKGYFKEHAPALSMGMSADFPVAIAEGATIVRVGTAIFGDRPAK